MRRRRRSSGRGARKTPTSAPDIRRWFAEAGFKKVSCEEMIENTGMRVGVHRLSASPEPLRPGQPIFTFYR